METGNIVEFIDSQKIICAAVLEVKSLRLRLITENNREVKLAVGRLTHRSRQRLEPTMGRQKMVDTLKHIAARRRALSAQIDIPDLWSVLNSEQQWIDLATMTALCFPDDTDSDHEAAVIRAFFTDRLYFKFNLDRFHPNTPAQVEQIVDQRKAEARQERLSGQGAAWIQKVLEGRTPSAPEEAGTICDILASFYLFEKDSPHRDMARTILKRAGATTPSTIFSFLAKVGVWDWDENLDLLRYGIASRFSEEAETHADTICRNASVVLNGRRDLRSLPLMTIDGPSTQDFDDALSMTREGDHYVVGIHITDVGYFVAKDDLLDQVARERCSSIYMPDGKISMLPARLSEDASSLKAGHDRPAISTLVHMTAQAEILSYEIVPSLIRVDRQLTFQDVDLMVADDSMVQALYTIARNYRQHRLNNGALLIDLPEINIWLQPDGTPVLSTANRESPGRMLVSEFMILANELAARLLTQRCLPAIFRCQAEPRERLFDQDGGTLFQNWMQRKQINRFTLSSVPERHAGLGLPAYITATSPIRKFSDLVNQRQLRAVAGLESPYTQEQIDYCIASSEEPLADVGRIQFRRQRYWLLKYLQNRTGQKEEALVLFKRREGYVVLLTNYMIECALSGAEGITLRPEDLIQVTLQHVNARNDVISVYYG
jgi:exoribonuclease II